ncbi:MAG: 30S ribosomal protein S8 [Capsulimonas sp.]|jgi:small subunit ribosomal protein S8|uniref:Small ribosomal subunit protein uS8 n=1 Tax=Capsulimonas corticalis TaxID=2219043 RepID=A0A402CYL6_9BACT|nr:30S ribosomal protein S8 [Capsulimonas corticalis]MCW3060450.1 small subunit ribosomal protein [Capsulimonas sp.]BDI31324.1 30S ribosomal protein S8 [Capsulimonas corticalis]
MPVSDPIADLLTRIRNANSANHDSLEVSASNVKIEITKILLDEGYIKSYEVVQQPVQNKIKITLKYGARNREKVITDLKRISKPGLRIYRSHDNLPTVLRGLGIAIVTTSQGVMTAKRAKKLGIGGEVIAHVW